ncbi:hypothetical protein [Synechococcus sp. NOUM97013]|uniref:hypothetical protein n=1 Tax=Synechococcus sp. NOUM97013 TaxID=1442555 RepID=UPI0016446DAC|nr:hypothetical protein [Synechococcus sp. NOUM97013]QNI74234.1 putative n-acetylmannosamine-6-phosphate 2-epimerase [Synechococcus sp. NOUM97013]
MTQSPYQHQDPRRIDLQRQLDQAQRDGDSQRLARLELQWVHRFGVDSLPQRTQVERIDAAADQHTEPAAVPAAVLDERPTEVMAGVEEAISETAISETAVSETAVSETATLEPAEQTAAVTADSTKADQQLDRSAEEQLVDSSAESWSALEPVPGSQPAFHADQEPPIAGDSRFSRFTALLKDCLDDVGRVVDRDDSTSSVPPAHSFVPSAAPSPRPVPASGPRRVRRWLAPVDADDLPKAS